jgi:signal transduction histidine kinase
MAVTPQDLRAFPVFAEVPELQLQWLIDHSRHHTIQAGGHTFQKDDEINEMHIVLKGKGNVYIQQNGGQKFLSTFKRGDVTGLLPYSRIKKAMGNGVVLEDIELLSLHRDRMPALIQHNFELVQVLVQVMTDRIRDFTQSQIMNEKLLALGKLSAGLAHELNNPASAILRSAVALKAHLQQVPDNFKAVIKIKVTEAEVDLVNDILFEKITHKPADDLSLMERTDKEDELADWLESRQVQDSYDLTENLIDFGFEVSDLERLQAVLSATDFPPVLHWISQNLTTEKMVEEIREASQRIADLVGAIKAYSYMDKSLDMQAVDIKQGIYNTLMMLKHRIKKQNIQMKKSFPENLPKIKALPGELNQVWTNLIDNALDAMEQKAQGEGILEIEAIHEGDFVKVNIIDNGAGIPADIKTKIFEPFFTTKEQGKGTGLGLDIVGKIMRAHNADIKVVSAPGRTEFRLCFPIE